MAAAGVRSPALGRVDWTGDSGPADQRNVRSDLGRQSSEDSARYIDQQRRVVVHPPAGSRGDESADAIAVPSTAGTETRRRRAAKSAHDK